MSEPALISPVVATDAIGTPDTSSSDFTDVYQPESRDLGYLRLRRMLARDRILQSLLSSIPLAMADLLGVAVSLYASVILGSIFGGFSIAAGAPRHLMALSCAYVFLGIRSGLYPGLGVSPIYELRQQVSAVTFAWLLLLLSNGLLGEITPNEVLATAIGIPLCAILMPIFRYAARYFCSGLRWWGRPLIIVGAGPAGEAVYRYFVNASPRGFRPVGLVDDDPSRYWNGAADAPAFLGTLDDLPEICRRHRVSSAIAVVSDLNAEQSRQVLVRCSLIPDLIVLSNRLFLPSLWARSCDFAGLSGIHIQDQLLSPVLMFTKRSIDVVVSSVMLICAFPILLAAAVALKVRSPGPVFYGHSRTGRHGRRFRAWKIRTMVADADAVFEDLMQNDSAIREEWDRTHKLKNDPRVIPGLLRLLRKTSLDELPQLWNVVVGDMSLVGPRPLPDDELEDYGRLPFYYRVRPGITGLWQVSGRNNTTYGDKVQLDTYYVRNWSLWLDYYVLLRTVRTVILREGAY